VALHVAILADERLAREALREWLATGGYRATVLDPADLTTAPLRRIAPDLVLLDADTRRIAVSRAVTALVETLPTVSVVLLADPGSVPRALRTLEAGAFDVIEKPARADKLQALLHKVDRFRRLRDENQALKARLGQRSELSDLVGSASALERLDALFHQVAGGSDPVLLTGERGTGKVLLARILHGRDGGDDEGFVEVDAAMLRAEALWRRVSDGIAAASRASAGASTRHRRAPVTVCLLGVETASESDRARMVAAVSERRWPVEAEAGTTAGLVRPVVTSRLAPDVLVRQRVFTDDEVAALGAIRVHLPPLRESGADLLRLAERLLARAATRAGRDVRGFDMAARRALLHHGWEGNVRELLAAVDHAVALCEGPEIGLAHLPAHLVARPALLPDGSGPRTLREVEHAHILRTLTSTGGNKLRAARLLGINRMTLYNKLREIQAAVDDPGGVTVPSEVEP
jgi:DNA-binding NtrC family response regulator